MKVSLIPIGNSQGVRLPKSVIDQASLTPELELEVGDGKVILSRIGTPRHNWEQDAMACHAVEEDRLDDWDSTIADFEGEWK
ncbi:MAG: AbrB/MazE/SpoVT family DNA-binding domain-containing protein [Planctomycetia bacterium]|nr:AbrB/MazE/SpoVT family DNA-binding domain-containing protein [Planctomycetia bacterium]